MSTTPWRAMRSVAVRRPTEPNERGMAMITLLVTVIIVTLISMSLIGLMKTDMTHASIHHAMARSFYIAQAGLEEAKLQVFAAPDPVTYTTPAGGVTEAYGHGRFTYWVAHEPETACGMGLTTLEAVGQVAYLNRTLSTRLRACGVAGAPFVTALFGVGRIQLQGAASRLYLAPYLTGRPGGGGNLGSFTEINFSDNGVRVNALSEVGSETVTLRDGRFLDYMLFGFPAAPVYGPTSIADPAPWILGVVGDIIKAQPATGLAPNPCGTPYACVTVGNSLADITRMSDLRNASYVRSVYMNRIREATLPRLALAPAIFRARAAQNAANAAINKQLGFPRRDAVYSPLQFYQIVAHLAANPNPSQSLLGTVFVDGSFLFSESANLGDITLAVGGDLVINKNVSVAIRHDLSTVAGRRTPGVVVFGARAPAAASTGACDGDRVNGSGRFVLCEGSTLTVDGLVYTQDGMAVHAQASVDQVGAMYHDNRGTANPSFSTQDATIVLRLDPLALSVFGQGVAILSWRQMQGRDLASPAAAEPLALAPIPLTPATATPTAAPEPPAAAVPPAASRPAPAPPAPVPPPIAPRPLPVPPVPVPLPIASGPMSASPATVAPPSTPGPLAASPTIVSPPNAPGPRPVPAAAAAPGPAHRPKRPDPTLRSGPTSVRSPSPVEPARAAVEPLSTPVVQGRGAEFHVQAGAFKNRAYADDLVHRLHAHGYTATLTEGPLIRVWVGPPLSREAAERLAAQLREKGFEALLRPAQTH